MGYALTPGYSQCLIDVMYMDGYTGPAVVGSVLGSDCSRYECAHQMHVSYYSGVTLSLSIDEVDQADLESHGSPDHANDV